MANFEAMKTTLFDTEDLEKKRLNLKQARSYS